MITTVKDIAWNPLNAANIQAWEAERQQMILEGKKVKK